MIIFNSVFYLFIYGPCFSAASPLSLYRFLPFLLGVCACVLALYPGYVAVVG